MDDIWAYLRSWDFVEDVIATLLVWLLAPRAFS